MSVAADGGPLRHLGNEELTKRALQNKLRGSRFGSKERERGGSWRDLRGQTTKVFVTAKSRILLLELGYHCFDVSSTECLCSIAYSTTCCWC